MELINSSAGIENVEINECTGEEFLAFCAEAETPAVNPDAQAAPAPAAAVNVPAANATAPVNTPASPAEKPAANATPQPAPATAQTETKPKKPAKRPPAKKGEAQSFISVNIKKMDLLMDLIGELVIAEATVLQNPDLKVPGIDLSNFQKSAAQLSKITSELQDAIMAMRMMPLKNTFQK